MFPPEIIRFNLKRISAERATRFYATAILNSHLAYIIQHLRRDARYKLLGILWDTGCWSSAHIFFLSRALGML